MKPLLSVIIPTHNPHRDRLERSLKGLQRQTLESENWELILVDNATRDLDYLSRFDLRWHPNARVIREDRLGLTWARIAGIQASQGDYLVFVDDDNVLHPNYLRYAIAIFGVNQQLGAIAGKILPEFAVEPPDWIGDSFRRCLALRDLGDRELVYPSAQEPLEPLRHPDFLPVGAGMALRRSAVNTYVERFTTGTLDLQKFPLDRTGRSLSSGGDCDLNLTVITSGWQAGYFPQLQLTHLIPSERLTKDYLAKLNYGSSRSWVQVLAIHGICPWQPIPLWSVIPRQIKAFFSGQAWRDPTAYIRWRGACGIFVGLSELDELEQTQKN
ncbi:Glycosyl transferase family 2 [Tumidithrix helvetica PCC 7403]|uniref:glycosyltransferase n=1 Tax=Tumidithrix helvetica TaxID=3457545 RepID=UPI003C80B0C2